VILSDIWLLYQIYVKGLVYNFHHLISLKNWKISIECCCFINFTSKHGQLNLTYGTKIWNIKHFKNSLLWILCSSYLIG